MDIVKTRTGKTFHSDYFATIEEPQRAYIRILNSDIAKVASVFSNPEETLQLWYNDIYISQFTRLIALIPESGAIKVVLAKG